jgi:hypothetical protein
VAGAPFVDRRSRRRVAPSAIGRGGPTPQPQPGSNPAAGPGPQPAPTPTPTPHPQPGPAPPAQTPKSGPLFDLSGIGHTLLGGGQIALGGLVVGVALLILVGQTGAGGEAARGATGLVRRGARAIPVLGALA